MPRKYDDEQEQLGDIFADIFHSFKDLHNVAPIQIIKRLDRKGVIFARKSKRRVAQKSAEGKR
jgi:hypothetical protein